MLSSVVAAGVFRYWRADAIPTYATRAVPALSMRADGRLRYAVPCYSLRHQCPKIIRFFPTTENVRTVSLCTGILEIEIPLSCTL
jgi:hypothetical protein